VDRRVEPGRDENEGRQFTIKSWIAGVRPAMIRINPDHLFQDAFSPEAGRDQAGTASPFG
jgi:hypothetical protein